MPGGASRCQCGGKPSTAEAKEVGNRNTGHTYGTALPDNDRWALVGHLKTL